MLQLEEALQRVLQRLQILPAETVPLREAHGRFLAEPLHAPVDLPLFDNSAMDGFAVQASDTLNASPESPVALRRVGRVEAGAVADRAVGQGECIRIFTGSALPKGADAVVMQEDTRTSPDRPDLVSILAPVTPWENVRLQGEDIKRGCRVLSEGQDLRVTRLALAGALGVGEVKVRRKPVVGILATGSELIEPGTTLEPGQIYESNRLVLGQLARHAGAEVRTYPLVKDSKETTRSALEQALDECGVVVSSGGVSVGELDFVKEVFFDLGGQLDFWKIAIKPGKPFVYGELNGVHWFGLPGNPVSALVTFLLLVRPALLHLQGSSQLALHTVPGRITEAVPNRGSRRHFIRVHWDESGATTPTGAQASHMLGSLAAANGLVDVAPRTILPKGAEVRVLLFDNGSA